MRATEITVQVWEDLDVILKKLNALGYTQIEQCTLNDWYFTHLPTTAAIEYAELMANSFLVRQVIKDQAQAYLYYKDKEIDAAGNVVSEEKTSVQLANLHDSLQIFRKAHLNCWCELQQTMYTFRRGDREFCVQAVAGLGNFIEYEETPALQGLTAQQKIDAMAAQLKELNLKLGDDWSCKKVYLLYLKHRNHKS